MSDSRLRFKPFNGLKEALERRMKHHEENEQSDISEDELFQKAMADVREIAHFRTMPVLETRKAKSGSRRKERSRHVLEEVLAGKIKIVISDTDEYIEWVGRGIRGDIARRLHGGEFSVQDHIDLHGLTLVEAGEACCDFIRKSRSKALRCVKVVHGRGLRSPHGPVIKEALVRWLQGPLRKYIDAYATARDCDGGLGATYLLLKK